MRFLKWLFSIFTPDEKVQVLYGYPANRKTWLTIYHRRKSDTWEFEWDDLFDNGRPKSWGDISNCLMFEDEKKRCDTRRICKGVAIVTKTKSGLTGSQCGSFL
ncbi:hypothetical protein R2538_003734 [Citrobacter freundii]